MQLRAVFLVKYLFYMKKMKTSRCLVSRMVFVRGSLLFFLNCQATLAQDVEWAVGTRNLTYDYVEDEKRGYLDVSGDWDGAPSNYVGLSDSISFTSLADEFSSEGVDFPGEHSSCSISTYLSIRGDADLWPNPPCYHATLSHKRVWSSLTEPAESDLTVSLIRYEKRKINDEDETEKFEVVSLTIPEGAMHSSYFDLVSSFEENGGTGNNDRHSETVTVKLLKVDLVTINSFIRQNNIDHPFYILPGPDRVFHGDNRRFDEHGTYRTQQKFSVVTQQAADANGLLDNAYTDDSDGNGEYRNATGITGEYDKASSLDSSGNLTQAARDDTVLNDDHLKVNVGQASIAGMSIVPNRLADGKVEIFCKGSAADPLIDNAPTLDYEFTIVIDRSNPSAPVYSISGPLDGFPDYEVYINGQRVFGWDAASRGQTAASLPWPMEKDVTDAKPNNLNQPLP